MAYGGEQERYQFVTCNRQDVNTVTNGEQCLTYEQFQ